MEEIVYTVRYYDPICKKIFNSAWKMTEADAAKQYPDTKWEILRDTKEVRKVGGGLHATSMANFQGKGCKG